jgi:hypothetical protein
MLRQRSPMNRGSGFKRPVVERAPRPPVTPGNGRGVYAPASDLALAQPKEPPIRSESYRRWVASLPCIVCRIEGYTQAAHPNRGRGLGQKASDLDCFPLCATRPGHMGHHAEHDLLIEMTLDERREREAMYIDQTRELAKACGRPEVDCRGNDE